MNILKVNRRRLLRRFLRLVKIDSISLKEGRMLAFLKRQLSKIGVRCIEDDAGDIIGGEAGNLIGNFKGNFKKAPKIMLNAHLDTVPPLGKIIPRVRKGYIYSDGTTILGADNKAGIAVILETLRTIKEGKISHGDIQIIFTVAEEIGLLGAKNLAKKYLKADFGYTMDGGALEEIINSAPSQDNLEATVIGKAAHAGVHPEKGINAIKVASCAISKMRIGRIDKETTANIGIIKGGIATNIIPPVVEIKGEARSHKEAKLKRQIRHMERELGKACGKFKASLKLKVTPAYKAFKIGLKERVVAIAEKAAESIKLKAVLKPTGGGSDANIFNASGLPSVILGVGAESPHTTSERIAIEDMVSAVKFLITIIEVSKFGGKTLK